MYSQPGTSVHGTLQARIFPTQGLNMGLPLCRYILYHLNHQGSPQEKITGMDSHSLLQGIFPTQESNQGLLRCRWILYQLSFQGSPQELQCRRSQFDSWSGRFPWRRDRLPTPVSLGFPGGSDSKESACNAGKLGLIPGLERSPGEGNGWLPTPIYWPGEFHGQKSLAGYSPWGRKELDKTE